MKGYRRLLGFMVEQNFERKAPGEFAPCCPMDACKPDRYAKSDQSWEGGELSRIKLSYGRARGEKFRVNERGLLNLSRKRCVVVWRRDAAAVPSRVCSSCGTRFFCLIASEAEHTQAGGRICLLLGGKRSKRKFDQSKKQGRYA